MSSRQLAADLRALGMDKHSYRALPLLPLVHVAWADGEVQASERDLLQDLPRSAYDVEGRLAGEAQGVLIRIDGSSHTPAGTITAGGLSIGRARDSDIQVADDGQISREHRRVEIRDGHFYLKDLGSTVGTWVNGERVIERRLLGGEALRMGATAFRFELD